MHDSEEKATHQFLIPLLKSNEGVPDGMSEDEEEEVIAVKVDSTKDDVDSNKDADDLPTTL